MTRTHRSFPVAFRVAATACALFALAWAVPAATAQSGPTQQQVEDAEARRDALKVELDALNAELGAIQQRLNEAAFKVDSLEGVVEKLTVDLLEVRERIESARSRYDEVRERLNERAAAAFIEGPGSDLEFLLGASTLAELSDRVEFVDAVAESDAALAQEVENLANQLMADEAELNRLRREQRAKLDEAQATEDAVLADLTRQQELMDVREEKWAEARDVAKRLGDERDEMLEELRAQRAASTAAGGHASVPMPPGYADILQACPVGQPRGFGDGFGAPRYVGGYHPHRGVDIVAPEGTPIYAAFSGYARNATNIYGGTSVIVEGSYGYVYNAHMSSIAKLGPVSAGDLIGYVSSTGLAGGSTPHNHFEFHPDVIPAQWPQSYYGYSVIGDAINPYPLLVAACG
jgi:murein DD-endopeptidase MepM/ murein hydrolase activator NlpD